MKQINLKISCCRQCPYFRPNETFGGYDCGYPRRQIPVPEHLIDGIPLFCPLEDED